MYSPRSWLDDLPTYVNDAIRERMTVRDFAAGATLRSAGDHSRHICLVDRGYIRLLGLHPDGRQVLILLYGPGNCFGESPIVAKRPSHHTTIALTEVRVHALADTDFWELYTKHREIADVLCLKFANSVTRQFASRELRATYRLSQQIASTFGTLAQHCGTTGADGTIIIDLPLTQADFAEHLEVTRQAVQREISAMKQAGILAQSNGMWLIKDPARLRLAAGNAETVF